jgi:putative CocE/NonD family hydrolase
MTIVEYDREATMRDGVVLRADVYRPSAAGPWPVLLVRTPYDKQDPGILGLLDPLAATRRGFIVVVQDVRGRFRSGGAWEPMVGEGADGHDTIRWAARLPGADGRVGTYGPSYLGQVQVATLAEGPPELVAAAVAFTWADPYDGLVARGGAAELGLITHWSVRMGFDVLRRRDASPDEVRDLFQTLDSFDAAGPDRSAPGRFGVPAPGRPDGPPLPVAARALSQARAPVLVVAGWFDPFLQGSLDVYASLHGSGLLVGPWTHNNQTGHVGEVAFGAAADARTLDLGASLHQRQLDWLDAHLRPDRESEPEALVFVMGARQWRRFDSWPPESAVEAWYLQEHGGLGRSPSSDGADTLCADPANPVPTRGGAVLISAGYAAGPVDQRPVEDRDDVLVYTSEPLAAAVTVLGRIDARVFVSATAPRTDVVVRLCDVDAAGVSRNITDGVRRIGAAGVEPQEVVVDLWSTAYVFAAGHRIRVQITWSNFPRWDLAGPAELRQSVHHGAGHPSRIVLPVA